MQLTVQEVQEFTAARQAREDCTTCGRPIREPRIVRVGGVIVEGCVDISHEHVAGEVADAGYPAWLAAARAAGLTGIC